MPKDDYLIALANQNGIEQILVSTVIHDNKNLLAFIKPDNYKESIGGHLRPYESLHSGAKREALEEANLDVKISSVLGFKDFSLHNKLTRMYFLKGDLDFRLNNINLKKNIVLSSEHVGYLLIPIKNLNLYKFKHDQKSFLADYFTRSNHRAYVKNKKGLKLVA